MSAAAETPAAPKAGNKKLILLVLGAALGSAAIAGGAVFFLMPKAAPAKATAHAESTDADGEADADADAHGDAESESEGEGEGDGEGDGHGGGKGGAIYVPMAPAFVVNVGGRDASNFLQVEIQLRVRGDKTVEALTLHDPQIRDAILMLLGSQSVAEITSREGKEALQKAVLAEIRRVLKAETGKAKVDAVYFTSFVMQ